MSTYGRNGKSSRFHIDNYLLLLQWTSGYDVVSSRGDVDRTLVLTRESHRCWRPRIPRPERTI